MQSGIKFIFLIILIGHHISAQFEKQFRFTNFGKRDGLNDVFFYQGVQDHVGYIWIGSGTGLYQYDGERFRKYDSPLSKPDFLLENILQCVTIDSKGNLWLSSINSLQWFNPTTRKFSCHSLKDKVFREMCNSLIQSIHISESGDAWFTTSKNTVFRFKKIDSSFHSLQQEIVLGDREKIRNCYTYKDENAFIISSRGIYIYNIIKRTNLFIAFPAENTCLASNISANKILLNTDKDLILEFDMRNFQFTHFPWLKQIRKPHIPFSIIKNQDGIYHLGGYGFMEINTNEKTLINKAVSNNNDYDLKVNKIVNLFYDREGNLWLCSHFGLSMLSWQNSQMKSMPITFGSDKKGIEPAMILPKTTDEWFVGTTNHAKNILVNEQVGYVHEVKKSINNDLPTFVYFKIGENIYASDNKSIYKYEKQSKVLKHLDIKDQHGGMPKDIYKAVKYKDNGVLLTSYKAGFYIWEENNKTMTHYNRWDIDENFSDTMNNSIIAFFTDKDNNIWLSTSNGIYTYNLKSNKVKRKIKDYISEDRNLFIYIGAIQTTDGHIWFNSIVSGLYEYWEESNKEYLKHYNHLSNSGMGSSYCLDIIKDPTENCLWVFNILGLLKFNLEEKKVTSTLNMQRGLNQDVYGYYKSINNEGKLLMSYFSSLDIIPLATYKWDTISPKLSFNSIKVTGNELIKTWGNRVNFIDVPYKNNYVEIDWAALHYNNSNIIEYRYNLNTRDTSWISVGNKSELSVGGLKEGRHVIRIHAYNCDGLKSKDPLVLHMHVIAPFWRQSWFLLTVFFSAFGGFYLIYQYRMNQVHREAQMKMEFSEQLSNIELRALRAQMNPHFIFNCLNSIQKYILKNDQYHASQYLTKFSRLIRLILDQSNQNYILLQSELELLQLYVEMEQLRFDNVFEFIVQVSEDVDLLGMEIPSLVIQPYIENAIWHGLLHKEEGKGNIVLQIKRANDQLKVVIEDNGVGRQKANELRSKQVLKKKSYGMKITEDRISIFNAIHNQSATHEIEDIYDGNTALGTRVIITIPFTLVNTNN